MPSAKRKLDQMHKDRAKVAKTNQSISDFFSGPKPSVKPSPVVCEFTATESASSKSETTSHIPQTSSTEQPRRVVKAKHRYGFDMTWTESRPWLFKKVEEADGLHSEVMFCKLCMKHNSVGLNGSSVWTTKGCRSLRLDKVVAHEQSEQHQTSVKIETHVQLNIPKAFNERPPLHEKEFQALVAATKLLHFLIKHNIPHTTVYEDLIDFAINELQSPVLAHLRKGKNATYKSRATADELLTAMSEEIETSLRQRVLASPAYAVMADEATDNSNQKHLAFCVKYVNQDCGSVCTNFIKDVQVDNGKAETIFNETKSLVENDLNVDKFVAFGSDGCNAMVGKKTGVATRLKKLKPDLITVHCHNHRLALAAKDSFEDIAQFRETDDLLSSIFRYYKLSANRTASLEKIQTMLENQPVKRMKQVAHTRWLSHLDAVTSLRDSYQAVVIDLENATASGTDQVRLGSGPSATGLAKKLKQYKTASIIHFLCDALRPLTQLALTFEKNSVDLSIIKPRLETTISSLTRLKTSAGPSMRRLEKLLGELNVDATNEMRSSVTKAEHTFIDNLVNNIQLRLENSDQLDSMAVFNMSNTDAFAGCDDIESLAEHFSLDIDQCLYEWDQLKNSTSSLPADTITGPSSLLQMINKLKPTIGDYCPNIEQLCATAAVVPVSTAQVERVFSAVHRTVSDLRNRLKVDSVNKLLHVMQNDAYLDFTKTVERWHSVKSRRLKW